MHPLPRYLTAPSNNCCAPYPGTATPPWTGYKQASRPGIQGTTYRGLSRPRQYTTAHCMFMGSFQWEIFMADLPSAFPSHYLSTLAQSSTASPSGSTSTSPAGLRSPPTMVIPESLPSPNPTSK